MEINDLISEGRNLADISNKKELERRYGLWCGKVRIA